MGYGFTMYRDQAGAAKLSRTNFMVNVSGIVNWVITARLALGSPVVLLELMAIFGHYLRISV